MDGSKEKIFGKFKKNANNADIHIRKIEPYSTLSNQSEQSIQELKKDSAWKMMKTGSRKRFWDDWIEFEAYVRSNIADGHAELKVQTPEKIVSGETADIYEFAEFGW